MLNPDARYGGLARLSKDGEATFEFSRAGVAGVPGSAFGDSDSCDNYMRFCIAREDEVLQIALDKLRNELVKRL